MGAQRIWMTAGRGGVGTGFCTVNLALALSRLGRRVLLLDGSPVCRSLDTYLSCEEDVVYDLSDLCAGRIPPAQALLAPPCGEGVMLVAGVFSAAAMPRAEEMHRALDALADSFDEILVDAPPLPDMLACAGRFDLSCVVSDTTAASLRGAERVGIALQEAGAREVCLLLNRFSLLHPGETAQESALAMVDRAHVRLLGIIPPVGEAAFRPTPQQENALLLQAGGPHKRENARLAFLNVAKRLTGEKALLLAGMRGIRFHRRALLY